MAEWLQVTITAVSIAITIALLIRQLWRARKQIRVRPRLDILRITVQLAAVIVVASLLGTGAPIAALIMLAVLAAIPGYLQGSNLEITDTDGRLYAVRNTVAAGVWAVGLVVMQTAGLLRRTGVLSLGQATAWIGVGIAVGLFVGRRGPIAEYRRAAAGAAAPAAMAGLLVLTMFAVGRSDEATAQDAETTDDRWVLVDTFVNPDSAEAPPGWNVSTSSSSMSAVHRFSGDDTSGAEGTFDATWTPPPATLVPGEPLVIPTTVSGSVTGNRDTQFFFGLHVIMIVDGRWNDQAVSAGASCAQTTVISGIYECSEPETNSGELSTNVPTWGETFNVGVGALNCGGACYVGWEYEFEAAPVPTTTPEPVGDDQLGGEQGDNADDPGDDELGAIIDDIVGRQGDGANPDGSADLAPGDDGTLDGAEADDDEDIEPAEAMAAAIAGVISALATGGISLVEAMDRIIQILDEGSTIERTPTPVGDLGPGAVIDERGNVLLPGDDGLYDWDTPSGVERVSRDDLIERIDAERAAIAARQSEHDAILADHTSDAAAAERFGDMLGRTIAENDALMDEIRAAWDRIDERQSALDRRDAALSALEAAMAEQEYEGFRTSWDQMTLEATQGMGRDVVGLPGEMVDLTRAVVTAVVNKENARVVGEAIAESIYDTLGIAAGNTFGDGAESIGNGVKFTGELAGALADALARDPVGTLTALTPINDFANAVDGDRTLGERLGSLGIGLVDIGATLAGVGMANRGGDLLDAARLAEAAADAADATRDTARILGAAEDAVGSGRGVARATNALEDGAMGTARVADSALRPEMIRTREQISDAITSARAEAARRGVPVQDVLADMPETRRIFQGGGMKDMGKLESAGGLSDEMAQAVVQMHDEITGRAIDIGTRNALDDMYRVGGMRPQRVLMGNSGSVGTARSVMTDADRTVVLVFGDDQLDTWRASRGLSRSQAQDALQRQFTDLQRRHAAIALNDPTDPAVIMARQRGMTLDEAVAELARTGADDPAAAAVRLNGNQMDMQTYSGFGSLEGANDLYPAGFTQSRQSIQGSTDVYRVNPDTGAVTSYRTSGQAIIDQHELTRMQTSGGLTASRTQLGEAFSDATRIPDAELGPLLRAQLDAVDSYNDVKSVAKAVDRVEYIARRTGRPMADQRLVEASVAIRSNPRATTEILDGLGMSHEQFVTSCQSMVRAYGTGT